MKIRRGLPPGYMKVDESLCELIERLHQLDRQDVREVAAFIEYLHSGAEQLTDHEQGNGGNLKLYDFMEGGIGSNNPSSKGSEELL